MFLDYSLSSTVDVNLLRKEVLASGQNLERGPEEYPEDLLEFLYSGTSLSDLLPMSVTSVHCP